MTNRMKEVSLNRRRKSLIWISSNGSVIKFFSDETIFRVNGAFNRWNDHCIISSSGKVHHTMTSKHPADVMALLEVSSECNVLK